MKTAIKAQICECSAGGHAVPTLQHTTQVWTDWTIIKAQLQLIPSDTFALSL